MGKLLAFNETFKWENTNLDRSQYIMMLSEVILTSKNHDTLYKATSFNNIDLSWGNFIDFFFNYGFDSAERTLRFPWMNDSKFQTMLQIIIAFKNSSEIIDDNIVNFRHFFSTDNCEHIGLRETPNITNYISCISSYKSFHFNIVKSFDRIQRNNNKDYFNSFYEPELTRSINHFNSLIRKGNVPNFIDRLDPPHTDPQGQILHEEKIHVHFNNDSSLNIDGTWKHGQCDIPDNICNILILWGFKLPENLLN